MTKKNWKNRALHITVSANKLQDMIIGVDGNIKIRKVEITPSFLFLFYTKLWILPIKA
ncbi:hypothetical protein EV202_10298 [Bacteroides heparinolyticus]|uniref:Uncharacterized protein n=1 Tax=Prevotella heparinolytica TaxID=28113 RepID=A0A4V2SF62_9BACE|nr:hypothetical protein EV202_10298 [Bacteroides heparinolyticus]